LFLVLQICHWARISFSVYRRCCHNRLSEIPPDFHDSIPICWGGPFFAWWERKPLLFL